MIYESGDAIDVLNGMLRKVEECVEDADYLETDLLLIELENVRETIKEYITLLERFGE